MSFTDHKITQFQHRVADLPDQPTLPPADLKSRFDACPEELRQSLNAVCDDAARLEARVEGIVVDTFGDTIDKEMLSDELAAELDGKATQSALDSTADALDERLDTLETAINQRCQVFYGTYQGNEESTQFINLGFTPQLVIVGAYDLIGMATPQHPLIVNDRNAIKITENGFNVYYNSAYKVYFNEDAVQPYIALK